MGLMELAARTAQRPRLARFFAQHPRLRTVLGAPLRAEYTVRHYVDAVIPRDEALRAVRAYPRFFRDRRAYQHLLTDERLTRYDDNPQLLDWSATTPFDPNYTYQDAWAAREIAKRRPERHVDVGSRITFVIGLSAFVPVTFIDLRPLEIELPGLDSREGDLLGLPYEDATVESLSCLHVAEHVGLGRYGDPLDPEGTVKAARELQRILAPGGFLYFSLPVGRPRTAFNAHRVHDPLDIVAFFPALALDGFAGVDDSGVYHPELDPTALAGSERACGFYRFTRR